MLPSVFSLVFTTMEDAKQPLGASESAAETSDSNIELFRRFIQMYESLPELWNTASPLYSNKYRKNEGYKKLLQVYRKIKPDAKEVDVKKQINSLRSNYRRELNKMKMSLRNGSGSDEVYRPTSWKFYALTFLHDSESQINFTQLEEDGLHTQSDVEQNKTDVASPSLQTSVCSMTPNKEPPAKRMKAHSSAIADPSELLKLTYHDYPAHASELEDEFLNIAKVWAYKLRNLQPMQRKFAEKAINDILFEADMGNLYRDSVQIYCATHHEESNIDIKPHIV